MVSAICGIDGVNQGGNQGLGDSESELICSPGCLLWLSGNLIALLGL
jgi:hypothetical protein